MRTSPVMESPEPSHPPVEVSTDQINPDQAGEGVQPRRKLSPRMVEDLLRERDLNCAIARLIIKPEGALDWIETRLEGDKAEDDRKVFSTLLELCGSMDQSRSGSCADSLIRRIHLIDEKLYGCSTDFLSRPAAHEY